MSDEYAIRPTDQELAEWTSGTVAQGFPEYYEDRHYELLVGMFEELIELRAHKQLSDLAARQRHTRIRNELGIT